MTAAGQRERAGWAGLSLRTGRRYLWPFLVCLLLACNPVTGTGPGTPPDPGRFLHADAASQSAVLILIAGYPATDNEFNYDGYENGQLEVIIPRGWSVTVQCQNHTTVPNSCAVVSGPNAGSPLLPAWATPNPELGLAPGGTASFSFPASTAGDFRIASLAPGGEAAGMWLRLVIVARGKPSIGAGD